MDNPPTPNPLPEKVVRRHAEMLAELLPDLTRLVLEEGRPVDALLNAHLRSHREMGSRDRRFMSQAVFSFFRWYGWTVAKLNLEPSAAALVGTALDLEKLPQSFRYIEQRCALPFPVDPMGAKSVAEKRDALNACFGEANLEIADLVLPDFGSVVDPTMAERCIVEFQQRPPTWIRSRTEVDTLVQALADGKVPAAAHAVAPAAVSVEGGASLGNALAAHANQFVVQDIASQCVGLVAAPQKGGDWWDCCAGAGGKALHLMDLMEQDGKVLASDVRTPVLKELKKRARKYGIKNIRTQPFNAATDEPFTKTFDGVVADAPCSGWGTWSRNPDARWRSSRRDVIQCATRQLKILNNVKWCVKPGGVLIYAVCTVTRPETEEIVMNFLDQQPDFRLDPFTNPLTGEPTNGQLQIWPWNAGGDGMFIARFKKAE
ncbi:RsmB/NOP family class I SAM-dependent RNA methyltransferase [Pontiella sp.]|uniref:RsmB/NOP family class I SAM-dependent RNA methyltransferase n=1 Tax=Pontiella sp. TaxID=2837462 RepID=UPI00356697B4